MIEKYRDISIIHFGGSILTVACDSCGGVGSLDGDIVKTTGFNVGYHTAFVALAETLAIGAEPILIVDTLSVSLGEYGKSILSGIKSAAEETNPDNAIEITGSSEENFPVASTGIGVTVLGQIKNSDFRPVAWNNTYDSVLIGVPHVGNEVLDHKSELLTLGSIKTMIENPSVLDLVPAGSRGVLFEAKQLAKTLGMNFNENTKTPDLLRKSSGPATCAVAAIIPGSLESVKNLLDIPVELIGTFSK